MRSLRNIFKTRDETIKSYDDFWKWFQKNEKAFFRVIKKGDNIEPDFFDKISPKLDEIKEGFFYLAGMFDENTAELVITADGTVKNIVFVEELISAAPNIRGWKFTALKPPLVVDDSTIHMDDYVFGKENISFYSNDLANYPDEIDITVVYHDYIEEDRNNIVNGTHIYLDNFLGELNFATMVDSIEIIGKADAQKDLVPIEKLKGFLVWREKEFIEKYEGVQHDTNNDEYSILEAELESGNQLIAVINADLLEWDSKASHPWIMVVELKYDGTNRNGMPDDETYQLLNEIEDMLLEKLKDYNGYLNIGRQTADGLRVIYFACKDFREPSKAAYNVETIYGNRIEMSYDIYKDKYWQTFNRFIQ